MPHLDEPLVAVAAVRATPARFRWQRQLRHFALRLVPAPAAFDEQRGRLVGHATSLEPPAPSTASVDLHHCMEVFTWIEESFR